MSNWEDKVKICPVHAEKFRAHKIYEAKQESREMIALLIASNVITGTAMVIFGVLLAIST